MTVLLLLQGGGVLIGGGNANFNDCQIYNNEATYVSACLVPFLELSSMAPMDQQQLYFVAGGWCLC